MKPATVVLLPLLLAAGCHAAPRGPVADADGLAAALAAAGPGDTIILQPGDYGRLQLRDKSWDRPVTLRAAQPGTARFARIALENVRGLIFDGTGLDLVLGAGEGERTRGADIRGGGALTFRNCAFSGTDDGNPDNDGFGLNARGVDGLTVENCTFRNLFRGAVFAQSRNLRITGNQVDTLRSDGFDFAEVDTALIAGNRFRDFFFSAEKGDHADFIQFWTNQAGPSANITIRDNIMLQGKGRYAQGIFIRSESGARYGKFVIQNNLYQGISLHGITIDAADAPEIRDNTILNLGGQKQQSGINTQRTSNAIVERNIACTFNSREDSGLIQRDNLLLACRGPHFGARDAGRAPGEVFSGSIEPAARPEAFVPRDAQAPGWRPR
ncbi:right-handed parallel beta-helix repeat-containing protein [Sandaracinobacteroides saxicola]|uniref:Right-handed parallel beta-helix repeat-containing protein n=1 Tax=Sandaracinobacteroides saxicola TaxID=2759707 RepID=A0A7G5IFC5_9SPHN|nr:right-handed parallel beta-helix repeat-containing protein [Sandaracinobacteroides saxicola]QMW22067.1 right-handed parallel beta-helix repeat-containing protein [Sandaracinobacteroides saxicola]